MPGRESSSSVLALLISIRAPLLLAVLAPDWPAAELGELVWPAASTTAEKRMSKHRLKFIGAILAGAAAQAKRLATRHPDMQLLKAFRFCAGTRRDTRPT